MREYKLNIFEWKSEMHSVLCSDAGAPYPIPSLYAVESLSKRSEGTRESAQRALSVFYRFFLNKFGCTFDDRILYTSNWLGELRNYLSEFSTYLRFGLVGNPCPRFAKPSAVKIESSTHNNYIYNVGRYLKWICGRFGAHCLKACTEGFRSARNKADDISRLAATICEGASTRREAENQPVYHSVPLPLLKALDGVFTPSTFCIDNGLSKNPFRTELQLRNCLIFRLLAYYGLRKGELFALQTHSLKRHISEPGAFSIKIDQPDGLDPRARKGRIKNNHSHRELRISESDAGMILKYIAEHRGPAGHDFLFTSRRGGRPLCLNTANIILSRAMSVVVSLSPGVCDTNKYADAVTRLRVHDLRHTWASNLLERIYEKTNDMKIALDQLRLLGGWAISSDEPKKYAERFLAKLASSVLNS